MTRKLVAVLVFAGACLASATIAEAQVDLKIVNGRIWLVATNATVGQILDEWARIGGTEILNGDRVPGAALTLELADVSEQEALEVLLQSAAGYMAVRRQGPVVAVSGFDRILILPTSTVSATPSATDAREAIPPVFAEPELPPVFAPGVQPVIGPDGRPLPDDQQDGMQGTQMVPPQAVPGQPPTPTSPPVDNLRVPPYPSVPDEPATSPGTPVPGQPTGVPFPGMIVPTQDPTTPAR